MLAVVLHPFIPRATAALWIALGAEAALGPLAAQPLHGRGSLGSAARRAAASRRVSRCSRGCPTTRRRHDLGLAAARAGRP